MKPLGQFHHIQINSANFKKAKLFYIKLFRRWRFEKVYIDSGVVGYSDGVVSIWVTKADSKFSKHPYHRKAPGLNHLAFRAPSKKQVLEFHQKFLVRYKIKVLYEGPQEYPEYGKGYFSVFFEDPDRMKIEYAYVPLG